MSKRGYESDVEELLVVPSSGILFTPIQKFLPEDTGDKFLELSHRRNIVVITDEANRCPCGFKAKLVIAESHGQEVMNV